MSRVIVALAVVGACAPARKIEPLGSIYVLEVDVLAADGATLEVKEEDSPALAGTRLKIPPGALASDTRVTLTIGPDIPEDGATPAGPTVEIGPLNTRLEPAAELTLPLTAVPLPALARVYARDTEGPHPTRMPDGLAIGTENGAPVVRLAIDTFLAFQPAAATNACAGRACPDGAVCRNGGCFPACNTAATSRHIMFVVDQTPSLATSDPTNARLDAIIDVIDSFAIGPVTSELEDGVAFAILGFSGGAVAHTESSPGVPGFSSDGVAVKAAVTELATTVTEETAYDHALATAADILDESMSALSPAERARAAYQVVLITDAPPTGAACDGQRNSPGAAVRRVEAMVETAAYHDVWLRVSTALIADPVSFPAPHDTTELECMRLDRAPFDGIGDCTAPVTTGDVAGCVLGAMARSGGGTLSRFSDVEPVDFGAFDFEPAVSTPCPDGFECQPSHSLCMPRTADGSACTTDQGCPFRSVCVAGTCINDEFGCGSSCQPTPDAPLKVIFALDASASLAAADPDGLVRRAIRDAIATTSAANPYAAFRIVGYHSETLGSPGTSGCPVFSRNLNAMVMFMNGLTSSSLRDTQGLLNVAREDLRRDMEGVVGRTGCGLTQDQEELARTHYAVVLISAGLPAPTCTLGFGNDFDPLSPSDPYALCEDADYASCLLKRDLETGSIVCTGNGTCTDGAAVCTYEGNLDSACCDTDHGWNGIDAAPHERLFGGLAGESELRGGDAYNQPFQLDARVRSLIALREQRRVADIRLHTMYVPPAAVDDDVARALLERLASTGRGLALAFPGGANASFAALGLDSAPDTTCADRIPNVTCGTPPPACPAGTYPEHSDLQTTECGIIATWTGACLPCDP